MRRVVSGRIQKVLISQYEKPTYGQNVPIRPQKYISDRFLLGQSVQDTGTEATQTRYNPKMTRHHAGPLSIFLVVSTAAVIISLVGVFILKSPFPPDHVIVSRREVISQAIGSLLSLEISDRVYLTLRSAAGGVTNIGSLANNLTLLGQARACEDGSGSDVCYEWPEDKELRIRSQDNSSSDVHCYDVTWTAQRCATQELLDCYDLSRGYWFGGFQDVNQFWPMNRIQQKMAPYVTGDTWAGQYGDVIERLFVSSTGFGIFIYPDVPLFLSFNENGDKRICLAAKYTQYPYSNKKNSLPVLRYEICQGSDVKAVHGHMTSRHVPKPRDIPSEDLFGGAIWSTWAMYKGDVTQAKVLEYARAIQNSGLPYTQLEIDDRWTPTYGDLDFDRTKFPDPKGMISTLTQQGFRVSVWMHPFFNIDSSAGQYGARQGYFIRGLDSRLPALVSWWRGDASFLLDATNPEAVEWYLNKTRFLHDAYNVTSFKYDAGETNWLPNVHSSAGDLSHPDDYGRHYALMAVRSDPDLRSQEVRVGFRSQDLPIMFRMLDRQTNWGYNRALKTVIPCALTFGIIGYPFVLPDMIGGNGYNEGCIDCTEYAEPELFIRWLQVNTFLPFIQFSTGPWVYNDTVIGICRKLMNLRSKYTDVIKALARESTRTGAPIVRPLWWIAPEDEAALTTDSQFLLGDDLLVAPVLEKGARSRDIYLPTGSWKDELRGGIHQGPTWLRGYSADIDELPYFQRTFENQLSTSSAPQNRTGDSLVG